MYNELIKFQLEFDKVNERLLELNNEKTKLVSHGASRENEFVQMLASEDVGVREQRAKQKECEGIQKDIEIIEKKISAISNKNAKLLDELIEQAKFGHDRQLQRLYDDIVNETPELRKAKANYLKVFLDLHEKVKGYNEVRTAFKQAAASIGRYDLHKGFYDLPTLNLTSNYGGEDERIGIITREVEEAYRNGKCMPWVRLYIEQGILVETNQEAEKLLKKEVK